MTLFLDKKLLGICHSLNATLEEGVTKGSSCFVRIAGRNFESLGMDVQYVDKHIYCVYFLNNQYFELSDNALYHVIESLLKGDYEIKTNGLFKKRRCVAVRDGRHLIMPEETTSDSEYLVIYKSLMLSSTYGRGDSHTKM